MKPNPTTIISLNTRLVSSSSLPPPDRITRHHIDRLIKQGCAAMPRLTGYYATLALGKGCAQLVMSKSGRELLTAGLAWANHDSDSAALWTWLLDFRAATLPPQTKLPEIRTIAPPSSPWLATLYRPAVSRLPLFEATALVVFQRDLIAHLSRHASRPA